MCIVLLLRQVIHLQKHRLEVLTLHEGLLQSGIGLTTLFLLNVYNAQIADLIQESIIRLVINQESKFLHSDNHTSASFLFS